MPAASAMVRIDGSTSIPVAELRFTTGPSSGPGGQNVNKVETRVTLTFDLEGSPSLDAGQKARIRERLANRVTRAGVLRVTAQRHRTQAANRELVLERFVALLAEALAVPETRRPTRVPRRVARERLAEKRRRGATKRLRSDRDDSDR